MRVEYDKETDILTVTFSDQAIIDSDEEKPGMVFDYDENGNVVSIEIFAASERMTNPEKIELFNVVEA